MSQSYLIWSTRLAGWISRSGGGTSEWRDAKEFSLDEALVYCIRTKQGKSAVCFPVSLDHIQSITS